jgi:hypothetical protein
MTCLANLSRPAGQLENFIVRNGPFPGRMTIVGQSLLLLNHKVLVIIVVLDFISHVMVFLILMLI